MTVELRYGRNQKDLSQNSDHPDRLSRPVILRMNSSADSSMAWALPIPVRRPNEAAPTGPVFMPPLPPPNDLSFFDDLSSQAQESAQYDDGMESKSDSETDGTDGRVGRSAPHPDDVLNGEFLRTEEVLTTNTRADSYYLVYSSRSNLVKIGVTLYSYEECEKKYTKLYGKLDAFHFLKIENEMTRDRLERAFYQFFSDTRMVAGKEFFRPVDSRGRPMVPIYLALLTQLTSSDIRAIRRFYLQHGTTALAARQWVEAQHLRLGGPGAAAEVTPEEAAELSAKHIISPAATEALARAEQHFQAVERAQLYSDSSSDSGEEAPEATAGVDPRHSSDADVLLAPTGVPVSLYLVHSVRSDLVKVGLTTATYEETRSKFLTVYKQLDTFHFLGVENDLLSHRKTRLERLFYRMFSETRITPKREFFRPTDALGRNMVPLYLSGLRLLAAADTAAIRAWYQKHRSVTAMQNWMEAQHRQHASAAAATVSAPGVPGTSSAAPALPTTTSAAAGAAGGSKSSGGAAESAAAAAASEPAADNAVKTFKDSPLRPKGAPRPGTVGAPAGGAPPPPFVSPAKPPPQGQRGRGAVQAMELEVEDLG